MYKSVKSGNFWEKASTGPVARIFQLGCIEERDAGDRRANQRRLRLAASFVLPGLGFGYSELVWVDLGGQIATADSLTLTDGTFSSGARTVSSGQISANLTRGERLRIAKSVETWPSTGGSTNVAFRSAKVS